MAGRKGMRSLLPVTMPVRYQRGFAWKVNQSSRLGRDLSATLAGLADHLGGGSAVSLPQLFLAERLAFLERRLREHETRLLNGEPGLLTEGEYMAAVGQLSGLCKALGLTRMARDAMTLSDYLAQATETPAAPTTGAAPADDREGGE